MKLTKRFLALMIAIVMVFGAFVGCSKNTSNKQEESNKKTDDQGKEDTNLQEKGRTIMWLSNISSGLQYETTVSYLTAICDKLGYKLSVVYGDSYNDAAGNLQAVKNGMTSDVVGLITSQDGGIGSIMEEFPELYVAGYNTDMISVYGEGGENTACLSKERFLGTICDGYSDGKDMAQNFLNTVLEKGYKKVAVVDFPSYAYPSLGVASETFVKLVDKYNKTAQKEDKIEVVGDITTLEFTPLKDSWFLEQGRDDLDCIVGACAGLQFIYPTITTAIANGTCSPDVKLVTGGFDDDESIVDAIGDDKTISMVTFSPAENPAFAIVLLDNAINGKQYKDWKNDRVDGYAYKIDSTEDINNVMSKSMAGTGDVSLAQLSVEDVCNLCVKNNSEATYQDLINALHDDKTISVEALANQ